MKTRSKKSEHETDWARAYLFAALGLIGGALSWIVFSYLAENIFEGIHFAALCDRDYRGRRCHLRSREGKNIFENFRKNWRFAQTSVSNNRYFH